MLRITSWTTAITLLFSIGAAQAELKIGDKAPEFEMKGSDGKTYKLSDFKGKQAVVIAWYPKAFTGGCTVECRNFREKGAVLKATGAAYFTASVDTPEKNADFAKSLSVDYPILSDPDKSVATAYGVINPERGVAQRWTFYIDKTGVVREIDKKVKTATAAEDVAATLGKLGLAK
ncbi:MAG: peroxiredoxin [Isosphaeraceae bacterium]|nr:peroxiredoxin [Isosphaeraceae bacterium]